MVKIGDEIWFTRGKMGKARNKWKVRWVGPDKTQRFVIITKPLNGRGKVMYIVIDCLYQCRIKEPIQVVKALDTDEEWARLVDDYMVGRRTMTTKNKVNIVDIEGLNDGPDREG